MEETYVLKGGTDEKKNHPALTPLLRLLRIPPRGRGLNDWSLGPQQLILEVVITSRADVEMNHARLFSLRLILVEDRAKHRQEKKRES